MSKILMGKELELNDVFIDEIKVFRRIANFIE